MERDLKSIRMFIELIFSSSSMSQGRILGRISTGKLTQTDSQLNTNGMQRLVRFRISDSLKVNKV